MGDVSVGYLGQVRSLIEHSILEVHLRLLKREAKLFVQSRL